MDDKLIEAGLFDILAAADRDLRARLPAVVFRKVDRIKSRAGWEPFRQGWVSLDFSRWAWLECGRCGDNFAAERRSNAALPKFCSIECKLADRRFRRRHGIAA